VWFLACPGTGLLNVANPWEVLGHTNDVLGRAAYELELFGPGGPLLTTGHGLVVSGVRPLPAAIRRLPELVVVAGSSRRYPLREPEAKVAAWLRRHHRRIPRIVSICTGAFLLGEAGLLDGRRATTHWQYLKDLAARFPLARVVDEGIYARDGKVWTSAGLTAGVDLTLALVEEDHGHEVAMTVARRMVLFLRRSGHQAQWSPVLRRQANEPPKLRDLEGFVLEHLDRPLSVGTVARGVGMSARTLSRWCRAHLDESPAELVRRLRLDEARRLLEETTLPLKDIAGRTGLGDPSTLFRVFGQYLGVTPAAYRERFAASAAE
jgi:transcriptional regulator GlxA family with amidase domain